MAAISVSYGKVVSDMHTRFLLAFALLIPASSLIGDDAKKNILMIAGRPSHGFGSHEHYAGLKILEDSVSASSDQVDCTLVKGWPDDASLIERADTIVIYSDGGGGHPAIKHLDQLKKSASPGLRTCLYSLRRRNGPRPAG